ncbi:MAG TPA: GNAT family protein [Gammaproteobacteria bacterium]|nr:GNAT family protein [Gammaproteobacteria bacterium]
MRVRLERPSARRQREYLAAVGRSRELHRGFVTTASTPAEYRDYLRRARRSNQESFFVMMAASGELAGVVNINDIVRHSEQSGRLGYYAFAPHAGAGLMAEGLALVIARAFGELGLHRLEANIQPDNRPSIALVRALGFRREGVVRGYLKIGGRWRDHERWALLKEDWRSGRNGQRRRAGAG